VTTVCWVATAFLGPQTDPKVLERFFEKVHPEQENFRLALAGWVAGCLMIWSALFTVGNVLYGRYGYAVGLFALFTISGVTVIHVVRKIWN
jgi:solute:Na+ symporter, SSS family